LHLLRYHKTISILVAFITQLQLLHLLRYHKTISILGTFITQLQLLHLLRYHKTISILGATLANAMWDLMSFGAVMGIIFFAFTSAIYLMYNGLTEYSTMAAAMGSQVMMMMMMIRFNFKHICSQKRSVNSYIL